MPRHTGQYTLFALCLAVFAAFLLWPIVLTLAGGFFVTEQGQTQFTLHYLLDVFRDPVSREGLVNSFIIAVVVTALCLLIAIPLAVLAAAYEFRGKTVLSAMLLVPLILPPFVGAIGLRQILGRYGSLNALLIDWGMLDPAQPLDIMGGARFWGVVIMEALHLYPILYLNTTAALANIDPSLEQAAENLGATRWQRFRRITLPLILPGLFAGSTIVFIWSFTELGTPLMFDYYAVTPVQIFWGVQEIESPRPYALVAVMLLAALLFYAIGKFAFGGRAYAMSTRATISGGARRLRGGKALLAAVPFIVITALAIIPHIGVVLASFATPGSWYQTVLPADWTTEHFRGVLTHDLSSVSINNSLLYASLAMIVAVLLGLAVAWLVVRGRVRGAGMLDTLAMMPLAVPGLVLAFGYVAMTLHWPFPQLAEFFSERGMTGAASMMQVKGRLPNPIIFLVIAYAIRRLPYVVRAAVAGLQQTSGEMEEAATNLGAGPLYTLRRILLPLILANLIAGGLLAFSFAMLEVSDSLILAETAEHYPITKAIYALFERLGDGPYIAGALGVWGMALLTITLIGASLILGRKMGAMFRI